MIASGSREENSTAAFRIALTISPRGKQALDSPKTIIMGLNSLEGG